MNSNLFSNKRLNDYDLNILNDNSFKDLDDKTLKLECLIAEKEEALENLNNKIKGAELLGKLLDVMDLKIQAKQIENELADLKEQYSKRNVAEKITKVSQNFHQYIDLHVLYQEILSQKCLKKFNQF